MLKKQRFLTLITLKLQLFGTAPTIAQPITDPSSSTQETLTRVLFKPPPEDKKPNQTRGAGSRHDRQCPQDSTLKNLADSSSNQTSLMPLVPISNFGLTIQERPTLWIYLPETSAKQVVLSIRENGTKHHSQTFIPITGESGIINLQPTLDSPPLEAGKTYQWAVVLVCGERPSPNDPAIASWVRRVALLEPINQGSNLEQAAWYGEQGIWHDALTSLFQARRSQPNNQDLINIWANFLESGGLKDISTAPLQFYSTTH